MSGRPDQSFLHYQPASDDYAADDYRITGPPPPPPKEQVGSYVKTAQFAHNTTPYTTSKESFKHSQPDVDFYSATPVKNPQSPGTIILSKISWAVRWILIVGIIATLLALPMIIYRNEKESDLDSPAERLTSNFNFYLSAWLVTTWLSACAGHLLSFFLPYLFRFVATYINPAHRRYWKIFRRMKWPITFLVGALGCLIGYLLLLVLNPSVTLLNSTDDQGQNDLIVAADWIMGTLIVLMLWAGLYFVEKVIILYICIHYHYRSDRNRIEHSKEQQRALMALYETSIYHYPLFGRFTAEDSIIHGFDQKGNQKAGSKPLQKAALFGRKIPHAFGHIIGSDSDSHFWKPDSHYATIERALEHPTSAAALAKRIWVSLVAQGRTALTVDDIAEALGPHRREEAEEHFRILDENCNGDIRLNEFVPSVVEIGRIRHAIYRGMHDIDHAINTFDWVLCLMIAASIIFYILISYVPTLKEIKDVVGFAGLGLSFALGRTVHEFLLGANFVLLKHPFDIGDRVDLFNLAENLSVPVTVSRISLLYVVFKRVDDGKDVQFPTERLNFKRIENLSRSGQNRETIALFIDFTTTFKDIQLLRTEMEAFLHKHENSRDFEKNVNLSVKSIHDLSKMELKCTVTHKSNWSNEILREARSSRLHCALVNAIRKVPIAKPGGARPTMGDDIRPTYTVMLSEETASEKLAAEKAKNAAKKLVNFPAETTPSTAAHDALSPHTTLPLPGHPAAPPPATQQQELTPEEKEAQTKREEEQALLSFMEIPSDMEDETRDRTFSVGDRLLSVGGHEASRFSFIGRNETGVRRSNRSEVRSGASPFGRGAATYGYGGRDV